MVSRIDCLLKPGANHALSWAANTPSSQESPFAPAPQQEAMPIPQHDFQSIDWLMGGYQPAEQNSEKFSWLFTEASLQELYCMAYMDSDTSMANAWA